MRRYNLCPQGAANDAHEVLFFTAFSGITFSPIVTIGKAIFTDAETGISQTQTLRKTVNSPCPIRLNRVKELGTERSRSKTELHILIGEFT